MKSIPRWARSFALFFKGVEDQYIFLFGLGLVNGWSMVWLSFVIYILFFEFRFGQWFARWFCFIDFTMAPRCQIAIANLKHDLTMEHWQIGWVG